MPACARTRRTRESHEYEKGAFLLPAFENFLAQVAELTALGEAREFTSCRDGSSAAFTPNHAGASLVRVRGLQTLRIRCEEPSRLLLGICACGRGLHSIVK